MDLYFVLSGTLAILCLFGVFESILKICCLNRWIVSIFLVTTSVFSVIGDVTVFNINFSLNLFLYVIAFILLLTRLKNVKNILTIILTASITLAILVSYKAINFSEFEYALIQPYVYVALLVGLVLCFICKNTSSAFCGTLIGSVLFEIIFFQMSIDSYTKPLVLGSDLIIAYTFICSISYIFFFGISTVFKSIKQRKQEKIET